LGQLTVAAFNSGNFPHVAKQLRGKIPDKLIIIAGDNDLHLVLTEGKNPGSEKSLEAVTLLNGKAIFLISHREKRLCRLPSRTLRRTNSERKI
jgi:phage/plasmid primase-like uncharacterized protein